MPDHLGRRQPAVGDAYDRVDDAVAEGVSRTRDEKLGWKPEIKAEGWSRCTMTLEPHQGVMKLTVQHELEGEGTKFIEAVSGGWPRILSNLKSLLETGAVTYEVKA